MTEVEELKLLDKNTLTTKKKEQLRNHREIVHDMLNDELRHIAIEYLSKKRDDDLIDSYILMITDKLHQIKLINELLDETNNPKSLKHIMKDIKKTIKHIKAQITEELNTNLGDLDLEDLDRESLEFSHLVVKLHRFKLAVLKVVKKELHYINYIKNIVEKEEVIGIWIGNESFLKHFLGEAIRSVYFNANANTLEITISISNIDTYFNPLSSIIRPCIENNVVIPDILLKLAESDKNGK